MKMLMISMLISMVSLPAFASVNNKHSFIHKIPAKNKIIDFHQGLSCRDCYFPNEFKLTVWNMYKGKNESWANDFDDLMYESDILLGQEFKLKGEMKDRLINPFEQEVILATSFISWRKYKTGVTNISKYPTVQITPLRSKVKEPFIRTPKLSLASSYRLEDGRDITFINIHAINFVRKRKLEKQLKQVIEYIKTTSGPVVFAGDFNTNSKKKIKMMRKLLSEQGFTEASFTGQDKRMKWLGNKLDYIWYRDLELIEANVLGHIQGADHKPLQASFRIPIE
ncbi:MULTISPECIES: endonuclease/exonuclease/phosphatase family protein [Halobacteriovorax]|uniref:Endonuclease/exonuclease/phosphatase family protein n=1 Tax=Halobacteriovorax vibrionivorans TaxID=2152716 RepID=A0ABY0IHY2_9BACT|nr:MULTISPECIES: endonuclease/exonuclease/phosphatase family protein [Halobacteriovorax]AYF45478.1 endonuclease/exonuclease/phosphatase family protein [Halobacteriovorax sp. BALOs_7]RZF22556.1 endonuclease/exonuclease/phosphatase family protein [Halobacteriovorax vibrionivorans]TGD47748.1 endonuclease/exonuclease/phosphatase family protein [Halobacteriovorax sp. Y22]